MSDWLCRIGPFWGTIFCTLELVLGIAIIAAVVTYLIVGISWLVGKIEQKVIKNFADIIASIILIIIILGGISCIIFAGYRMWSQNYQ